MTYMIAQRGSGRGPIKVGSIQFYEKLDEIVRKAHIDYINHVADLSSKLDHFDTWTRDMAAERLETTSFASYLNSKFSAWFIFECTPTEINKKTGKPKRPVNLVSTRHKYDKEDRTYKLTKDSKLVDIARDLGYDVDE